MVKKDGSDMLNDLGEKIVTCHLHCDGINNNPQLGIIPRCLIFEKRKTGANCMVVGLNPGKCKNDEKNYYLTNGIKYDSIADYFNDSNLNSRAYFKRIREIITLLEFDGDILWTDLAKCECSGENGTIPIQTLRVCINRFLRQEVTIFKCSTIFALGSVAFNHCALSFPNHFIVGIPHPTGSHGNFRQLREQIVADPRPFIKKISNKRDIDGNYKAFNLSKI